MEDLLYWIIEYVRVLLGYGFLIFVWPSAVFRKYLKGKSVTFRFGFCTTVSVVLVSTVVLMLGLVHILNRWTMWVVFYGLFIWSFREKFKITEETRRKFKYLITGTFGWKHLLLLAWEGIVRTAKRVWGGFWRFYKVRWPEYTLLVVTVVYGMLYFSWGAFQNYSYGFGDMYVHHEWIYQLTQGKIFSAGVYPEGMHCMIYSMHTLFGIDIYSCLLFLAGIHIAVILIAAYVLMKEIFQWRYSPIFVLILFLTLDVVCVDEVFSMSRLQWTLPQEYGFHTIYLCALFLVRYLRSNKHIIFRERETKACWDENLLLFVMALAASIIIHFYVTIMAFFLCAAFALFALKQIFNRKHFVPLIAAVLCGVIIAIVPMAGALVSGIPFQGSINWAVSVINGTDTGEGRTHAVQSGTQENETGQSQDAAVSDNTGNVPEAENNSNPEGETGEPVQIEKEPAFWEKATSAIKGLIGLGIEKCKGIYWNGYVTLYKQERANWIIGFTCLAAMLWAIYKTAAVLLRLIFQKGVNDKCFAGYLPMISASVLFMILYAAPFIGLPELIAGSRLCSTEQMLILVVMVIPIDMTFTLLKWIFSNSLMQGLSLVSAVGLIVMVWSTGNYHGYLYYELTRYNAAVRVTNEIMESLPQNSYTIVSPTDEIYQVIQNGRHEEMLTFLKEKGEGRYTLPTEYIFIYVEKKPLKYAHNHFFSGPDWLAWERYQEYYSGYSVCPEVVTSEISAEAAEKAIMYFSSPSRSYSDLESRTILESKAYQWCKRFEELYPNELKTYYEDESFVCYYIKQNTQYLYDLELE